MSVCYLLEAKVLTHLKIKYKPVFLTRVAAKLRTIRFVNSVLNGKRMNHIKKVQYPEFLEAEKLVTEIPR